MFFIYFPLGVGVVANDAHVMIGVCAMASLEFTYNNVEILLTEEGELPIRPVDGHGIGRMDVLNERAPTLGNDVSDLVIDLVLGHRRKEAECLQGGDCLVVTHGALKRHGDHALKKCFGRIKFFRPELFRGSVKG
jgi:hypothetical protein